MKPPPPLGPPRPNGLLPIERAIELWSNPGDVVLSPFMGIGSEGVISIERDRRFVGAELKRSYFQQAVMHLNRATRSRAEPDLFGRPA